MEISEKQIEELGFAKISESDNRVNYIKDNYDLFQINLSHYEGKYFYFSISRIVDLGELFNKGNDFVANGSVEIWSGIGFSNEDFQSYEELKSFIRVF